MERILYVLLALILLALATLFVTESRIKAEYFDGEAPKKKKKTSGKKKKKSSGGDEGVIAWMFKKPGE